MKLRKYTVFATLLVLTSTVSFCSSPFNNVKSFIKFGLKMYSIVAARVIVHELGHALAAKLVYDTPFDIHIGVDAFAQKKTAPWIQLPGFAIHSLNLWKGGYACYKAQPLVTTADKLKRIAVVVAGPIAGLVGTVIAHKIVNNDKHSVDHRYISRYVRSLMVHDTLYGFTPMMGDDSDGDNLWKVSGASDEVRNWASNCAMAVFGLWVHWNLTNGGR